MSWRFSYVNGVNYSPSVVRKALLDSQVTALINYCISCFTYPNYLPVALTMALLKIFFVLILVKNRKYEYVCIVKLLQNLNNFSAICWLE